MMSFLEKTDGGVLFMEQNHIPVMTYGVHSQQRI
jgi:hypothetical protein